MNSSGIVLIIYAIVFGGILAMIGGVGAIFGWGFLNTVVATVALVAVVIGGMFAYGKLTGKGKK